MQTDTYRCPICEPRVMVLTQIVSDVWGWITLTLEKNCVKQNRTDLTAQKTNSDVQADHNSRI